MLNPVTDYTACELAPSSNDEAALLELSGKQLRIFYNLKALSVAQNSTGINFLAAQNLTMLDSPALSALLSAGLLKHHPDMSVEKVSGMVNDQSRPRIIEALTRALTWDRAFEIAALRPLSFPEVQRTSSAFLLDLARPLTPEDSEHFLSLWNKP